MRPWRNRRILLLLLIISWTIIFFVIYASQFFKFDSEYDDAAPIELLWWTKIPGKYHVTRRCGYTECIISNNPARLKNARAVLFYAPHMNIWDMPLPRSYLKIWALLHDESPRNVPFVPYNDFLQHFNYTSTFSHYSNLPLTTQYLPKISDLTSMDYFYHHGAKEVEMFNEQIAPVIFLQSDCDTMSGREDYVRRLMKEIRIDSYGACLRNLDMPESLQHDYLNHLYSPALLTFLGRYKFMISIENGVCHDYITEKYWRPLMIGVIPIYFGAPNIRDWQPNNHSAIYVNDFASPKQLAAYLKTLGTNQTAYDAYRQHKLNLLNPIDNKKLLNELLRRKYSVSDKTLFNEFECMVCHKANQVNPLIPKMANIKHYNCPMPPEHVPLEPKPDAALNWQSIMGVGRCQARLLNVFWMRNESCTQKEYKMALQLMVSRKLCD